jgi:hypothetical protein
MKRFFQRNLLFALLLAGLMSADRHPLHLSSATLVHTSKNQWVLKKTLFTDDLEEAMTAMGYEPIRLSKIADHQATLEAYLNTCFSVYKGKGDPKSSKPIAWTLEAPYVYNPESVHIVLRFTAKPPFQVFDGTLLTFYADQKNVYSVRKSAEGWSQHAIIDSDNPSFVVQ